MKFDQIHPYRLSLCPACTQNIFADTFCLRSDVRKPCSFSPGMRQGRRRAVLRRHCTVAYLRAVAAFFKCARDARGQCGTSTRAVLGRRLARLGLRLDLFRLGVRLDLFRLDLFSLGAPRAVIRNAGPLSCHRTVGAKRPGPTTIWLESSDARVRWRGGPATIIASAAKQSRAMFSHVEISFLTQRKRE